MQIKTPLQYTLIYVKILSNHINKHVIDIQFSFQKEMIKLSLII